MKTILYASETGGPGGAETVLIQLATRESNGRFRNLVALPGPGWVADTLNAKGVPPLYVPIARSRPALDLGLYASLVRLIRRHRVDLVHSHALGISVYACLAGLRTRTPVVCTLHGASDLGRMDRRRKIKLGILKAGASKVVLVSDHLRDQLLAESRIARAQTAVIHNGVNCGLHSASPDRTFRRELGIGDEHFLFGAIGNVRSPKAYDDLLRAAAIAVAQDPNLRFTVVGEGSGALLEELLTLRAELGLQEVVHFAGFRPDVTVPLRSFDAFVLSSRSEGFSIATVQAMASGLAVVATRCGGPEEIVTDGVDGLLVPLGDPASLAAALLRVAHDPLLRAGLGSAARAAALAKFSLQRMLAGYDQVYADALGLDDRGR